MTSSPQTQGIDGLATNAPGCALSSPAASTSAEARYSRWIAAALAGTGLEGREVVVPAASYAARGELHGCAAPPWPPARGPATSGREPRLNVAVLVLMLAGRLLVAVSAGLLSSVLATRAFGSTAFSARLVLRGGRRRHRCPARARSARPSRCWPPSSDSTVAWTGRAARRVGDELLGEPVVAVLVGAHLGEPQAALVGPADHLDMSVPWRSFVPPSVTVSSRVRMLGVDRSG